jgi:hypothetical protein
MSRLVLCDLCDTNLGVLFEREAGERDSLDFYRTTTAGM